MFNFLLGNLRELGDRTLEIYRLSDNLSVQVDRIAGHFGDHVLLREVQRLLILQVYVDIRVLAAINLTILRPFASCRTTTADFQLHPVLLSQLVAGLLCFRHGIGIRIRLLLKRLDLGHLRGGFHQVRGGHLGADSLLDIIGAVLDIRNN